MQLPSSVVVPFLVTIALLTAPALAQQLPQHDVIDVPAIAPGLCTSNVFQSHMVVQRDQPVVVWGWASPDEEVVVSFGVDRQTTRAAADRAWRVTLAAQPANATPQQLLVQGKEQRLVLDDVLVGDVWVLGGQSNMEFELEGSRTAC